MNVKKLRIGNLLNDKNELAFCVSPFILYKMSVSENIGEDYYKDIYPITLTRKWLLLFGFYENRSNNSYQLDSDFGFTI